MPNLVEALRNRILTRHPGALLVERGERRIKHLIETLPDGRQHFAVDVGPLLHYHDGATWQEINTDWLDSAETGFTDEVTAAGFIALSDSNSRRRIYPRRGVTTEYVEFARMQAWNGSGFVNIPWPTKQRSSNAVIFDRVNASLEIIHTGGGIKVNVTLKDASAAARLRWPVSLVGLHRVGWQLVSDADSTVVATIRPPVITEDGNGPLETPRPVQCEVVGGAVEFTANLSGLSYPITIDPTIDPTTAASGDDGIQTGTTMDITSIVHTVNSDTQWGGFRFIVTGPASGDQIDVAYTRTNCNSTSVDDPALDIYAEDVDDAAAFTTGASNISNRTRTTASVNWTATGVGTGYNNSPSIVSVIQEVIDRVGWASGNALNIIWDIKTGCSYKWYTYDFGSLAPILHIEYTTAGATVVASRRSLLGVGV